MTGYSAIYLTLAFLLCTLSPCVIMGMGWLVSQNEKINDDNPKG